MTENNNDWTGAPLRELRRKLALTQAELGLLLGVSGKSPANVARTVRYWESGQHPMPRWANNIARDLALRAAAVSPS